MWNLTVVRTHDCRCGGNTITTTALLMVQYYHNTLVPIQYVLQFSRFYMYCNSHDSICTAIQQWDFIVIRYSTHIAAEGQEGAMRKQVLIRHRNKSAEKYWSFGAGTAK